LLSNDRFRVSSVADLPHHEEGRAMNSPRKHALVAGLCYLISFVSIPTLLLYTAVHEPNFIVGPGPDTPVLIGGVLEMIVALAGLGSAVALYPILKRQNQGMALGWSAPEPSRGGDRGAGGQPVDRRDAAPGRGRAGGPGHRARTGGAVRPAVLVEPKHDPCLQRAAAGAAAVLVPVGATGAADGGVDRGALLLAGTAAVMFGVIERGSPLQLVLGIPIALWEFSLGVYLTVRGFRPEAVDRLLASR
jgi:hypothetical protein